MWITLWTVDKMVITGEFAVGKMGTRYAFNFYPQFAVIHTQPPSTGRPHHDSHEHLHKQDQSTQYTGVITTTELKFGVWWFFREHPQPE